MATSNTADWKKIADEMRAEIEQRRYFMKLAGEHAEQLSGTIDALRDENDRLLAVLKKIAKPRGGYVSDIVAEMQREAAEAVRDADPTPDSHHE